MDIGDAFINSQDIIKRLEELHDERQSLEDEVDEAESEYQDAVLALTEDEAGEQDDTMFEKAEQALQDAKDKLADWDNDYSDEQAALEAVNEEAEGYVPDWRYGETLIREDKFVEYMEELAYDTGFVEKDAPIANYIDWEKWADDYRADYIELTLGDWTYYTRS